MTLNDAKIKSHISDYQSGLNIQDARENFRREVELYIYSFPNLSYRKDKDFCGDFYLYVVERLDSVLKNYPLEADIQFKTWFNRVLKNQMLNFYHYQKRGEKLTVPFEDHEEEIAKSVFLAPEEDFAEVYQGLSSLSESDRLLIRFYYMPQKIGAEELQTAVKIFGLPLGEVLDILKALIHQQQKETEKLRKLGSEMGETNRRLSELKYKLYQKKKNADLDEVSTLLLQIARLENRQLRQIRELQMPSRAVMNEFARLFSNIRTARYRLKFASSKLRTEILKAKERRHDHV